MRLASYLSPLLSQPGICAALVLAVLLQVQPASAADWLYTVRPGDKLWGLAERFTGNAERWREIAQYNELAEPTQLVPGTQLKLPLKWLIEEPAVARLVYVRGEVSVQRPDVASPIRVIAGTEFSIGAQLFTGAESYANVRFADGTILQVGPESEVVFDTLSAFRDTGMVDSRIRINRGSGASEVTPQQGPGSVYRISTPLGVAAVRGTEFRTRSADEASFVETVGGNVEFITAQGSEAVDRGYGLKADPQGFKVEELLAAPELTGRQPYGVHETLEWAGMRDATNYQVSVYTGPDLSQIVTSASVSDPKYALANLAPGSYAVGVRAVAASGLQGFEASQELTIDNRVPVPQNVLAAQPNGTKDLAISWQAVPGAVEYVVTATPRSGGEPVVRRTAGTELVLQELSPSVYRVVVQASNGEQVSELSEPVEHRIGGGGPWGIGGILLALVLAL